MQAIRFHRLLASAVLGLLGLAARNAHAQTPGAVGIPLTISMTVTGMEQSADGIGVQPFHFSNIALLKDIESVTAKKFPGGARLVLETNGDVYVEDGKGHQYEDLTSDGYLTINLSDDCAGKNEQVWQANLINVQRNNPFRTLVGTASGTYISEVVFNDQQATNFTLVGQTREQFSLSQRSGSDFITITGSGDGTVDGNAVVTTGTVMGTGRGPRSQ